jgi:tRNA pseudouridine55 synthase
MDNEVINSWIILDKPLGLTSTQATSMVRRITGAHKAGHLGTLDPLASGVLPIALGEATKAIPYIASHFKRYSFQITWGEQRVTDDAEGNIIQTSQKRPSEQEIRAKLPQFIGCIKQLPPLYSAIRINGIRAYHLARSHDAGMLDELNSSMQKKIREVTIHDLTLDSIDSADQATFTVACGPGTYVRSLARDLAEALETVGYVSRLRRIQDGKFHENDAISLENLREFGHKSKLYRLFLPIGAVLDDIPAVTVTTEEAVKIHQGQPIRVGRRRGDLPLVVLWLSNKVVAIAREDDGYFYPKRVFK